MLECYDPMLSQGMLRDLVTQVLTSVGCANEVERTVAAIVSAGAGCQPGQRFGLQFRAQDGALSVIVSSGSRAVWQTSCPMS
jgi:hypothetical protein